MTNDMDLERRVAELERRLANMVRIGTISEVDYAKGKARVLCDNLTTDWLPWKTRRAGGDIDWWAPEAGEQVEIIAPAGLMEGASISPALYSDQSLEPAASPDIHTIRYANGDSITHNRADGSYVINLNGDAKITANGNTTITTTKTTIDAQDTHITGTLTVDKEITGKGGMAISGGSSSTMSIAGSMQIKGNIDTVGNIHATGTITDEGGNTNNHSH